MYGPSIQSWKHERISKQRNKNKIKWHHGTLPLPLLCPPPHPTRPTCHVNALERKERVVSPYTHIETGKGDAQWGISRWRPQISIITVVSFTCSPLLLSLYLSLFLSLSLSLSLSLRPIPTRRFPSCFPGHPSIPRAFTGYNLEIWLDFKNIFFYSAATTNPPKREFPTPVLYPQQNRFVTKTSS